VDRPTQIAESEVSGCREATVIEDGGEGKGGGESGGGEESLGLSVRSCQQRWRRGYLLFHFKRVLHLRDRCWWRREWKGWEKVRGGRLRE